LDRDVYDVTFTPDGQGFVFRFGQASMHGDLGFRDLAADTINQAFLATEYAEFAPVLSPDGKWMAYVSRDPSRALETAEVFVRPFPEVGSSALQVSTDGGTEPLWGPNGRELFYRSRENWMVGITYTADSLFSVESRRRLFDARPFRTGMGTRGYDISPSDGRFVMVLLDPDWEPARPRMFMIQNFFTELEELVGR
jgi:hypothetical protein